MDARYAGALRAFLSHHPEEQPIDPAAPDPLRTRGPEAKPDTARRVMPHGAGTSGPAGTELLPLIFAQLTLEPSYRLRRRR
jgi:hypothetical protein